MKGRSDSPEYPRIGPLNGRPSRHQGNDRHERAHDRKRGSLGEARDEHGPRRRHEYRPPRSPSPRGFRNRDGDFRLRERSPDIFKRRDRRRSRSPHNRDKRFRSPSPRSRLRYNDDPELVFPRRAPQEVPDLQILAPDDVDMYVLFDVISQKVYKLI